MADSPDEQILALLAEGPQTSTALARRLGLSRQAAHARLASLVEQGRVTRTGAARATRYQIAESPRWERAFPLTGLAEDDVHRTLAREVEPIADLTGDAAAVVQFVVTELVNNAIDHSSGRRVRLSARLRGAWLELEIEDDGVGAFAHVRDALGLESELAAIQELSKGKTTTAPSHHSGEGLFFTSKAVDAFRLESGGLAWIVDNRREDMTIAPIDPPREGTRVVLELDLDHPRSLAALFDAYTEDFTFSKTRTLVRLFAIGVRFVSRSEAKRLLHGLERFREVVLDFRGVEAVGQGFADEVFRVWARAHPTVRLVPVEMNEPVAFMVERARRSARESTAAAP